MSKIISRKEWGAKHREGFGSRKVGALNKYLHHSVTTHLTASASMADEIKEMRKLEEIGQSRFKGGISYTTLFFPSGRIYEGLGVDRLGAHTAGHNTTAAGLCLVGNYEAKAPTKAQQDSLVWYLQHGVSQKWWGDPALTGGHRDTKATACPGQKAYDLIPEINKRGRGGAVSAPAPAPSKPTPAPAPSKPEPSTGGYTGPSLVDYLKSIGQPTSFYHRSKMAISNGIQHYKGTSAQNTALLKKLRGGGSTSTSAPRSKSISAMASEVIQGKHGNGHANRQRSLGVNAATYARVRAEVNKRL